MEKVGVLRYLSSFPSGIRFCPSDEVLIGYYLTKKLKNEPLPPNPILEVDLYNHNPKNLTDAYKEWGNGEGSWYFFTQRNRRYRNGKRPGRSAGDGYWKTTGGDKPVTDNFGNTLGNKKVLDFYKGKPRKGDIKTNWIMHEYTLSQPHSNRNPSDQTKMDGWALCRIHENTNNRSSTQDQKDDSKDERALIPNQQKENEHMDVMSGIKYANQTQLPEYPISQSHHNNDLSCKSVPDTEEDDCMENLISDMDWDLAMAMLNDYKGHNNKGKEVVQDECRVPRGEIQMAGSETPSGAAGASNATGNAGNTHDAAYFNQPYGATSASGNRVRTVYCNGQAQKSRTLVQDNNVGPHTNVRAMVQHNNVPHRKNVAAPHDHHFHLVPQPVKRQLNHVVWPTTRLPPQQFYPCGAVTDNGEPYGDGGAGAANAKCATCNAGKTHDASYLNQAYGATSATGNQVRTECWNSQLVPNNVNVGPQTRVDALLDNGSSVQQQFNTYPMLRLPPQQFYYPSGSVTDNGQPKRPSLLLNPSPSPSPSPSPIPYTSSSNNCDKKGHSKDERALPHQEKKKKKKNEHKDVNGIKNANQALSECPISEHKKDLSCIPASNTEGHLFKDLQSILKDVDHCDLDSTNSANYSFEDQIQKDLDCDFDITNPANYSFEGLKSIWDLDCVLDKVKWPPLS